MYLLCSLPKRDLVFFYFQFMLCARTVSLIFCEENKTIITVNRSWVLVLFESDSLKEKMLVLTRDLPATLLLLNGETLANVHTRV